MWSREKIDYLIGRRAPPEGLPHFLGIGAVKAGTTWLHANLFAHPEVYVPILKPVFYFDRRFDRPLGDYARLFEAAEKPIRGELTASYGCLPATRILFLRRLMPELKAIFLMRHPVERAWSDARMELAHLPGRDVGSLSEADFDRYLDSPACRRRGDYLGILKRWLRFFPRERIFVGVYEDIRERPRELLSDIFAFLGARPVTDWGAFPVQKVIFKGPEREMPEGLRRRLTSRYRPEIRRLGKFLGIPLERRWEL